MKLCILFSSVVLGVASCAVTESIDSPPSEVDLSSVEYLINGPTCGNGVAEAGEVCLGLPGGLVIDTEAQIHTVLAVDLNGDFALDLVAMTHQRVWIRYGIPAGGFGPVGWFTTAGAQYRDIAVGDFDGDTHPDLAIADAGGGGRVLIRRNNGVFAFPAFPVINTIAVGPSPTRILAARLDANIFADLVVLETTADVAVVLLSTGTAFSAASYPVGDAPDIALGDCDANASPDLLYVNGGGLSATMRARRNFGGAFTPPVVSPLPLVHSVYGDLDDLAIVSANLNADARDDVVVSTTNSQLPSATAGGACFFTPATLANTYAWSYRLRAVDWDLDGTPDIAAPHGLLGPPPPAPWPTDAWSIVFGDGAGAFASGDAALETPGIGARDVAFLDADADGNLDVALAGFDGVIVDLNKP